MRIYWYWPYIHRELLVVPAAVPRAGDHLVVHTMKGRVDPHDACEMPIEVDASLAMPADAHEHSLRWLGNRAATYASRVTGRHAALARGAFDVGHIVFCNYFTDGIDIRLLARKRALVWEVHDVVPHQSRLPARVERAFLRLLYSAPGTILVRHAFVRDRLVDEFPVDPARITVVPWPVPVVSHAQGARRDGPRTVLMFGTMRRNKGVDVLLRAIDAWRDDTDVSFVFAGRGFPDVEEQVRAAAQRDPRIHPEIGYVSAARKHELYSNADLVVLPYTSFASTSAVLSDAYAHHLPVVASDVAGLGASVRADETGWTVPPGDSDALASAMAGALHDEAAWSSASRHAAAVAHERTPACIGATLRALYDRIV
jgi:glycosyltransferase involved in cell wall biosynthesis